MGGAGLKYCAVTSLTTTNQTNLTTNKLVPQIRVPAPHVVNVSHGVKCFCAKKPKLFCCFFFDLDAQNDNSSSISKAASLIKGQQLRATVSTSHTGMLDSLVHRAPVSFMQDSMQDRLNVSVQLTSSSDAECIFSVMNDISHGCSGGMCLRFRPPCALHLPVLCFLFAVLLCLDHTARTNC